MEPSSIASGNIKWCRHFDNSLAGAQEVKHGVTIKPSCSTGRYIPKRIKSLCSHKNLSMNVKSSIIHGSQNVETTERSTPDK